MKGKSAKDLCACCAFLLALSSAAPVRAVAVDVGVDDPVVVFAADELKRILGAASNSITLREDASLKAQAWRLKTEPDGTLVISGRPARSPGGTTAATGSMWT